LSKLKTSFVAELVVYKGLTDRLPIGLSGRDKEVKNMSDRTESLLRISGLCPNCGDPEHSKAPYFISGEDEECSFCSGEFYCDCGEGTNEHQLATYGVCKLCQ
jgi:hypothetical protein